MSKNPSAEVKTPKGSSDVFLFRSLKGTRNSYLFTEYLQLPIRSIEKDYIENVSLISDIIGSVTRLGNLFDFGQLFKAFGNV